MQWIPCVARVALQGITLWCTQALSPAGRCKSFDASGDGYGRGEGFNAAVLRECTLTGNSSAVVLAVVQGSAVNQDGRSSSLTAPNGPAQQVLL